MDQIKAIALRLPRDVSERLKVAAAEDRRTMHGQIVHALEEHLRLRKRRESRQRPTEEDRDVN